MNKQINQSIKVNQEKKRFQSFKNLLHELKNWRMYLFYMTNNFMNELFRKIG